MSLTLPLKKPLPLFETKMALLRWINSADTSEQIELLELFINELIIPKFEKELKSKKGTEDKAVLKYDFEISKIELAEAIQNRKLILAGTPKEYPKREKDESPHPENRLNELT